MSKVEEETEQPSLEELKKQILDIKDGYASLLKNCNPLYSEGVHTIETETDKRIAKLEQERKDRLASSERIYNSQIEMIQNDYDREYSEVQSQITKLIQCKLHALNGEFPNFRHYFEKFNTPLSSLFGKDNFEAEKTDIGYSLDRETLLTDSMIEEDLEKMTEKSLEISVSNKLFFYGEEKYSTNDDITISIPGLGKTQATITEIGEDFIKIQPIGSADVVLPIRSLKMGLATIEIE